MLMWKPWESGSDRISRHSRQAVTRIRNLFISNTALVKTLEATRLMLSGGKYRSIVASTLAEIRGVLPLVKEGLLDEVRISPFADVAGVLMLVAVPLWLTCVSWMRSSIDRVAQQRPDHALVRQRAADRYAGEARPMCVMERFHQN